MKKVLEAIFVVVNFIVFLPALFCAVFAKTAAEEKDRGKDEDKALITATYILSLLNCAALWWLIYKVLIG